MTTVTTRTTVAAVVAYAASIRVRAEKIRAGDPWAKPYSPSEAAARKLVQRVGADEAIAELGRRAVRADSRYREGERVSAQASERHERHLRIAVKQERREREERSFGRRIDDALMQLQLLSTIPAGSLESEQISGTVRSSGPVPDDPMPRAVTTARLAAESVERELDEARRRMLVPMQPDRDVRLKELACSNLTAEQISIADPSQGPPSHVRGRLHQLGCYDK